MAERLPCTKTLPCLDRSLNWLSFTVTISDLDHAILGHTIFSINNANDGHCRPISTLIQRGVYYNDNSFDVLSHRYHNWQ